MLWRACIGIQLIVWPLKCIESADMKDIHYSLDRMIDALLCCASLTLPILQKAHKLLTKEVESVKDIYLDLEV